MKNWTLGENKPNSNPNKANLQKAKMNINSIITKDYNKKDDFSVRINKPNLVRRRRIAKMNVNLTLTKDYRKNDCFRSPKNKPNSNPVLSAVEWANFFKGQNRLPENLAISTNQKKNWTIPKGTIRITVLDKLVSAKAEAVAGLTI